MTRKEKQFLEAAIKDVLEREAEKREAERLRELAADAEWDAYWLEQDAEKLEKGGD